MKTNKEVGTPGTLNAVTNSNLGKRPHPPFSYCQNVHSSAIFSAVVELSKISAKKLFMLQKRTFLCHRKPPEY